MNELSRHHRALGARLAPDQIPLDYGDPGAEFAAALDAAILLDRSHEGRVLLTGRDRIELVNRMSTNEISGLASNGGTATIFTNPNARILFRVACFNRPEGLLLISEAGQGEALANYLRRNIFFGDQVAVDDITTATAHFALHGGSAGMAIEALASGPVDLPPMGSVEFTTGSASITIARRKSICGDHWIAICLLDTGAAVHRLLLQSRSATGLVPAGSLTYNSLRIRSGRPAGLELSSDFIPLEVGLWDEISFTKGCYTGQEIIARMESRGRVAKALVKIDFSSMVPAPAPVYAQGRPVGTLTSSVEAADGQIYALAVLKVDHARSDCEVSVGPQGVMARVIGYAAAPPPFISPNVSSTSGL